MELALRVRMADIMSQSEYQRHEKLLYIEELEKKYKEIMDRGDCLCIKDLQVSGKDLISIGIKPGPNLGKILKELLDDCIDIPEHNNPEYLIKKALSLNSEI